MQGYTMQHDRGDALLMDAGLPSPLTVMGDDRAAIGRELAAFHRGWGSADSEVATRLALTHAAERLLEIRAAQGQPHDSHLALHADLEDRVRAGVFPLPAGAAHAQPWALGTLFLQVARFVWAKHCERVAMAKRAARALDDERDELLEAALSGATHAAEQVTAETFAAEDAEFAALFDETNDADRRAADAAQNLAVEVQAA